MQNQKLEEFIARAGFNYEWENLENWARRMAEQAVSEIDAAKAQNAVGVPVGLAYPAELTPDLRSILGTMCFQIAREAALYRASGHVIAKKAEDEQAFMLDRFIRAHLKHGDRWGEVIGAEITSMIEARKDAHQQEPKP